MKTVPIEIFQIARTQILEADVQKWLAHLSVNPEVIEEILEPADVGDITDPALLIALAAKRCYMSFQPGLNKNVTKVRKDWTEYIDNILRQGHGSVLEHASFTFTIEGVSRVFTGEMNRHRAGTAISEGSMRYIRFDDIGYWLPTSITLTEEEQEVMADYYLRKPIAKEREAVARMAGKKERSQSVFARAFKQMEENYAELEEIWMDELKPESTFAGKKHVTSMMRRIIGMGVATGGVWTMNIRAVRHILAMRASSAAEEEIFHVFSRIAKMMVEAEPMLCGDFNQDRDGYWKPQYVKV